MTSRRCGSISSSTKSSAGLGKPARTERASSGNGIGEMKLMAAMCTRPSDLSWC